MADRSRGLVTGSRTWTDETTIRHAFADIIRLRGPENVVIVHGACPRGADALADHIARPWTGLEIERHPADWRPDGQFNRRAGFQRNAHMVNLGANICLAFIRERSSGATPCAALAEQAGIPVRRWTT